MKSVVSFCKPFKAAPVSSLADNFIILLISATGSFAPKIFVTIPFADNV
jgi:hypothetical protein